MRVSQRIKTASATIGSPLLAVTRQIEHAKAYATKKGWSTVDDHVYVDDGVSGAEFAKRPGFIRLMNVLKPKAPFQVLIMSEESRLGREQIETAYALKQIITGGVRVFYYLEDRERVRRLMAIYRSVYDAWESSAVVGVGMIAPPVPAHPSPRPLARLSDPVPGALLLPGRGQAPVPCAIRA